MKNNFKNILELTKLTSNSLLFYILQLEKTSQNKDLQILISTQNDFAKIHIDSLNKDIEKTIPNDASQLKYSDSFRNLQNTYSVKSIYLKDLFPEKKNKIFLVGISSNETLFNKNTKDILELSIPIIKDFYLQTFEAETKLTENTITQNSIEKKYQFLIDSSSDLIFTLDKSGIFINVNKSGAENLQYQIDEIIGKHIFDLIEEEEKQNVTVFFNKILSTKKPVKFKTILNDKYSNKVWFEITAHSIVDSNKIIGMLGYAKNITRLQQSTNQIEELKTKYIEASRLIEIERDRAKQQISVLEELNSLKNEFISNVSHELRTPLASIIGFSETLHSDPDLPPEMAKEFISIILTEGKRLAKQINDILDFSKLESTDEVLNKTQFDIILMLKDLVSIFEPLAKENSNKLTFSAPEAEIIITADEERIYKAISNIVSNAIKFTESGGRISIIVQDFLKEVEIIISDTGIGIPHEEIPKLFQKFNKVHRPGAQTPGAGFGLVITKKIIDAHKGLIQIKSELKKGTSVLIRLPKNNK